MFGRQVVARERQGLSGLRRCCCKGCIEGIGRRGVVCWVREELKLEKNYDEWRIRYMLVDFFRATFINRLLLENFLRYV